MFNSEEDFKFHVREFDVFTLERLFVSNKIEFHNETEFGTNVRTTKYYIKNSDRPFLDKLVKENQLEVFIDSIPIIETSLTKIKFEYLIIALLIMIVIITLLSL